VMKVMLSMTNRLLGRAADNQGRRDGRKASTTKAGRPAAIIEG
jgi:hypothetical protein